MTKKGLNLLFLVLLLGIIGSSCTNDATMDHGVARNVIQQQSQEQPQIRSFISPAKGNTLWNQTYGGTDDDWASSVIQTADGGFVFTGATVSYGTFSSYDGWLVKTDTHGVIEWNRTYGGVYDDWIYSAIQAADGGYVVGGSINVTLMGGDGWLMKTDAHGEIEWNRIYSRKGVINANSIIQTVDGGYALTGHTLSFETYNFNGWLMKTDVNGEIQWERTYGSLGFDQFSSVIQTADGGFVLAGFTTSSGAGKEDFWLVKTDAVGMVEWSQTYGGTEEERAFAVIQTEDGGYALAGPTTSFEAGASDAWLVKTDPHGKMEWNQLYGDFLKAWNQLSIVTWDEVQALIQTADGGFVLGGLTESSSYQKDAWLMKIDDFGVVQWNQILGGSADDVVNGFIQTADGGFILAGSTFSFGAGGRDAWLVKTVPSSTPPLTRYISDLIALIAFAGITVIRFLEKVYQIVILVLATLIVVRLWKKRRTE